MSTVRANIAVSVEAQTRAMLGLISMPLHRIADPASRLYSAGSVKPLVLAVSDKRPKTCGMLKVLVIDKENTKYGR
jgi:hypothetical protein